MLYSILGSLVIGTREDGSPNEEHLISHMAQAAPRRMWKGKRKEKRGLNKHRTV